MREFIISSAGLTVASGSVTLLFLRSAAAPSVNHEVLRWWIGQSANATSAQQRIEISQRGSSFPTLLAYTPIVVKTQDPNAPVLVGSTNGAAGTAGINASGENGLTNTAVYADDFNVLNGWLMVPTPPETFINPAGTLTGIALRFPVAPGTLTTWGWGCVYREV